MEGVVVLVAVASIAAAIWHWLVSAYWSAVVGATVTVVVLFQAVAMALVGRFEPFGVFATIATGFIALATSVIVGLPFLNKRQATQREQSAP